MARKEVLSLEDLHNPNKIKSFIHINGARMITFGKQGFQEYPKSIELWEQLSDGRLVLVKRWHKKSVAFFETH